MEYIVIDTESCTGSTTDGSLCSIGYVIANENLQALYYRDILINPLPKKFAVGDKKNLKRTGVMFAYSEEEFRKAPTFKFFYNEIVNLLTDRIVLGFSMANDVKYINDVCDKFNLPRITYRYMDIQFLYQLLYPNENSIGLKTLAKRYGIEYTEHRSDEDAIVSLKILNSFLAEKSYTYNNLIAEYDVKYGINCAKGYHTPYSVALFRQEKGLKLSRKLQNYIFTEYLSALPKKLSGEIYCFSYGIEKLNPDLLRSFIDKIYLEKNSFTRDADLCTVYVRLNENELNDSKLLIVQQTSKRIKRIITLKELQQELNIIKCKKYDDTKLLTSLYEKLNRQ